MSVCHHAGEVLVGSSRGLLRLVDDTLLPDDRFTSDDAPGFVARVLAGPETAFLIGERDIFQLRDHAWRRLL